MFWGFGVLGFWGFEAIFLNSEKHVISSPQAIVFDPKLKKGKSDQYKKC